MYVIGECINGMFKKVNKAIEARDKAVIQELARQQVAAGADALDLNVGTASGDATEIMSWLVETVSEVTDAALSIDSPKWAVQQQVVPKVPGKAIINSCKADDDQLDKYMSLAVDNDASLIALTIDRNGVPSDTDKRVELGAQIVTKAAEKAMPIENVLIDPIILPVNAAPAQPRHVVGALQQLQLLSDPAPMLVLGLSNVSQNCNHRKLINRTYVVMAMTAGMNAVILDPLDTDLMNALTTTELLQEKAIYCDSFLDAQRMRSNTT